MKTKKKEKTTHLVADGVIDTKPSRSISDAEWKILWGRSAGRCQFPACNRVVYRATVNQQLTITAEHAHIIAFSEDGPRGETPIEGPALNRYPNLMLLCHDHHHNIDDRILREGYTVELLRRWKAEHEERVERVTAIAAEMETHVITYVASISDDIGAITEQEVRAALEPIRFPSEMLLTQVGFGNRSGSRDYEGPAFWLGEQLNLKKNLLNLKERLKDHRIQHYSIFAIAPQPLLIYLGTLLPELKGVEVYQRHKYPSATWKWPHQQKTPQPIDIVRPANQDGPPVLLLEFSAEVKDERIFNVVPQANIYRLRVAKPAYDALASREQVVDFHKQARRLLDEIKHRHGAQTPLHIFPVGPICLNVELGKVRAPKTDTTWYLYDQVNEETGFERVLELATTEGGQGC